MLGPAPPTKGWIRWSPQDVLALLVVRRLRRTGVPLQKIRKVLARLQSRGLDIERAVLAWGEGGQGDVILLDQSDVMESLLSNPGQMLWSLAGLAHGIKTASVQETRRKRTRKPRKSRERRKRVGVT